MSTMMDPRNDRKRVEGEEARLPDDVTARYVTTQHNAQRYRLHHEPCDDGDVRHGQSDGFIQTVTGDSGFVYRCKGCGETWPYDS